MKNTMLLSVLLTVCMQVHAEATQQVTDSQAPNTTNNTQAPPVNQSNPATTQQPNNAQPTQNPQDVQQGQPAQNMQNTEQTPVQQAAPVINCDYKIPAATKTIDQSLVLTWSEKATVQAFDFDPTTIDAQLQKLQTCFTDQGWQGFNTALQKSGNLEAIKSQKLTVSSQIDGQTQVTEAKDNQWKITLPLQVVYQNDKEKVTQLLTVNLTVSRKITGDLGITQMIATPRTTVMQQEGNSATTPANTTTTTTPAGTSTQPAPTNNGETPSSNTTTDNPASSN